MLENKRILEIAEIAIPTAMRYFGIMDDWKIAYHLGETPGDSAAIIQIVSDYRSADIKLMPYFTEEAFLWRTCGHEVAHVVLADLEPIRSYIEQNEKDGPPAFNRMLRFGIERAVNNLERLWVRDNPWPPPEFAVASTEKL